MFDQIQTSNNGGFEAKYKSLQQELYEKKRAYSMRQAQQYSAHVETDEFGFNTPSARLDPESWKTYNELRELKLRINIQDGYRENLRNALRYCIKHTPAETELTLSSYNYKTFAQDFCHLSNQLNFT